MSEQFVLPESLKGKRVALVHDWLTTFGGAERVVELWSRIFPEAPIHTTVFDKKTLGPYFSADRIRTSRLQRLPNVASYYRKLLSFMPRAFEEFDLGGYDVVLSSSSSCAKGVLTSASTLHASYVHTPMRYAWDLYPEYLASADPITRIGMRRMMPRIRQWDVISSNRVDIFMANSVEVAKRIMKVYRRDAKVVHPPIDTDFFTPSPNMDMSPIKGRDLPGPYLVVTRLVPYKKADIAVDACTKLNLPLTVIGDGPEIDRLRRIAGTSIQFAGFCSDEEIREAYRHCRAFLFPGFEDFGMTPVECQACGRPVIAYGRGGALETVVKGKTGVFFPDQTSDSLLTALEEFEATTFDPKEIRRHAEDFSVQAHVKKLTETLASSLS